MTEQTYGRTQRALAMFDAAEALTGTNSAVEIDGFRIEETDNKGETATTRNLHQSARAAERLEGENKRLKDALSVDSDDALCICITAGPAMEGPDEYCLTHGRTKAEWMEKYDAAQRRVNELDPDPFAIPEAPKFEGCTIEEWARQAKEFQASLQRTLDANTSLREQAAAGTSEQVVKLEAALEAAWEYAAAALGEQAAIREHASARVAVLETAGHVRSADENTRDKYHAALAAREVLKGSDES